VWPTTWLARSPDDYHRPQRKETTVIEHRMVRTNGIDMHVAGAGQGPAVLLLHGFPELWHSWRHLIPALAASGYRALAPRPARLRP
jgi:alpha-beta hydrolase superfamily lysophospholipase